MTVVGRIDVNNGQPAPSSDRRGSSLIVALVSGLVALLLLGLGLIQLSRQQVETTRQSRHALEVLARSAMVRADLANLASEGRAFIIDHTDQTRARFGTAAEQLQATVDRLRTVVAENPAQSAAIDGLAPVIAARVAFLQQSMDIARNGTQQQLEDHYQTQRGRQLMNQILVGLATIEDDERQSFRARERATRIAEQLLVAGLIACSILGAASVLLALAVGVKRNRERIHYAELAASDAERRRTEAALRESEARLRATADTIPSHLFEMNPDGACVSVNSARLDYSGLTQEDFATDRWLDLIHPDDRALVAEQGQQALLRGEPRDVEFRFRRHDGVYRWFLSRSAPVRDPSGTITRWVGTATDIDDQKRAEAVLAQHRDELEALVDARTAELAASEAQLRETAARFRLIAEHCSDMVSRFDADGTLIYVSPASRRVVGLPPEHLTFETVLQRVHPEDRPNVVALRNRLLAGAVEGGTLAYRIFHSDGHLAWVESSTSHLRDPATGKPNGYISILRDLTERRKFDENLRHAQRMEVIGGIASGVAHDFNNLLQTVIGGLELTLESMDADTHGREFVELALAAATRGSSLTHHLLSYARKQVLQPRVVELATFLADLQKLLARTLGPHITVRIDVSSGALAVNVDPSQLQTAILNLAINAADAMPEGGILTLGAEAAGAESGERLVALRVCDNGSGMDEATIAKACEPFFSTKGIEGTGLGLSMVQGFVEQSGGRMQIDSVLGHGTTIVLLFRAAQGSIHRPPDLAALPQPSRRVLVVDDEPDVLVTAGAFLERAGLWVVRARSGNEALGLLASLTPFDALVTDYAMPGMNGADLAIESQLIRPGLPVVIITGFAEVRGIEDLPGNVLMLRKPFLRQDLLKVLHQVMLGGDGVVPNRRDMGEASR